MQQIGSRFWAAPDKDSLDLADDWEHKWLLQGAGHSLQAVTSTGRSLRMVKAEHWGVGSSSFISTEL